MKKFTVAEEKLETCLDEIKEIVETHYKEVEIYADKIKLSPSYEKYISLEKNDMFKLIVSRDIDNKLIGYCMFFIMPHLHFNNVLHALHEMIYVKKEYRKINIAKEMIIFSEKMLKKLNVRVTSLVVKKEFPYDSICKELKYDYVERMYIKYLGEI